MRLLFEIDKKDYEEDGEAFIRPSARAIIFKDGKLVAIYSNNMSTAFKKAKMSPFLFRIIIITSVMSMKAKYRRITLKMKKKRSLNRHWYRLKML
ncbi:MAG: hypothetical protein K6E46_00920 [Lachnospiraceae bacterium]|nr:hypothetical protein [Lachnospiraceae bacterium]